MKGYKLMMFNWYRWLFRIIVNLPVIGQYIDFLTLCLSSMVVRNDVGLWAAKGLEKCKRPKKTLILYEFEGCPYCRKVREVLSVLDLDCIIYPCTRTTFDSDGVADEQSRFRPIAKKLGGKAQFPFMIDENFVNQKKEPSKMYESDDICNYLIQVYGDKCELPWSYHLSRILMMPRLTLATFLRPLDEHGLKSIRIPNPRGEEVPTSGNATKEAKNVDPKMPPKLLELFSTESSPFSKRVREVLSSLEIPYLLRNAPFGSVKRPEFKQRFDEHLSDIRKRAGLIQIPLLVDPNADDKVVLESLDIVKYLKHHYG